MPGLRGTDYINTIPPESEPPFQASWSALTGTPEHELAAAHGGGGKEDDPT